jgi:hypothetical protein
MPARPPIAALILAATLVAPAAQAVASPYLPPSGRVFAGVTGSNDPQRFAKQVGKHQPVYQLFTSWDAAPERLLAKAAAIRARPMLHVATGTDPARERISPGAIARGDGDSYLLRLNHAIDQAGAITYIRLMAEMNGHWNAYCAYDASGRSRGRDHSTRAFVRAWRRTVLIVRGGDVAAIDGRLRELKLPPVRTDSTSLPRVRVAFLWVPQTAGNPDTSANSPQAYWPGAAYVDWVGTDFYSRFPNFTGLSHFYADFRGKPFVFGEWAMWGGDDPAFVDRLLRFAGSHDRVRMLMYNQGNRPDGPFVLTRYPRARRAIERWLSSDRFAPFAPELGPQGAAAPR